MKKRILKMFVLCGLLPFIFIPADAMKIYHPDGSEKEVEASIKYIIPEGWFNEPVCYIYKPDGTKSVAFTDQLQRYLDDGWYTKPVCTVYSVNGDSKVIYNDELDEYTSNGWSETYIERVTIYAPDGRSALIEKSELDAYVAVGWYTEPVCYVYKTDGSTRIIKKTEIELYRNSGWTEKISDVHHAVYSKDGEKLYVFKGQVNDYVAAGWYKEPVCRVYHPSGISHVVYERDAKAYMKLGYSLYEKSGKHDSVRTVNVDVVCDGKIVSPSPFPEVVFADDKICRFPLVCAESLYRILDGKLVYMNGNYYMNLGGKTVRFTKSGKAYTESEEVFEVARLMEYDIDGVKHLTFDTILDAAGVAYRFDEANLVLYIGETDKKYQFSKEGEIFEKDSSNSGITLYPSPHRSMYSSDGSVVRILNNEVLTYKLLGWYESDTVRMYSPSGSSALVDVTSIGLYSSYGWITG